MPLDQSRRDSVLWAAYTFGWDDRTVVFRRRPTYHQQTHTDPEAQDGTYHQRAYRDSLVHASIPSTVRTLDGNTGSTANDHPTSATTSDKGNTDDNGSTESSGDDNDTTSTPQPPLTPRHGTIKRVLKSEKGRQGEAISDLSSSG